MVWLVVIAAMGAVSNALLAGTLTQDIAFTNKPESVKAQDIIDQKFSGGTQPDSTEFFIVQSDSLTVDDPQFQSHVQGVTSRIAALGSGILAGKPVSTTTPNSFRMPRPPGLGRQRAALITVLKKDRGHDHRTLRSIADQGATDGSRFRLRARERCRPTSPRSRKRTCAR